MSQGFHPICGSGVTHSHAGQSDRGHERDEAVQKPERDPDQDQLDAQLSSFGSIWDFLIAEDEEIAADIDRPNVPPTSNDCHESYGSKNYNLQNISSLSPSKRKASAVDIMQFTSPSKSIRSALSEMSPSKVNIRAQEKPDMTSVAPPMSNLPSPEREDKAGGQGAADILAIITTQDLEDDELTSDKENHDPWQTTMKGRQQGEEKSSKKYSSPTSPTVSLGAKFLKRQGGAEEDPFPSSLDEHLLDFDGGFDTSFDSEYDDYGDDLDEETLAALAVASFSPNKPVSLRERLEKVSSSTRHPITAAPASVSEPSNLKKIPSPHQQQHHQEAIEATMPPPPKSSSKPSLAHPPSHHLVMGTQVFPSEGIEDDDWIGLVEELDTPDPAPAPAAAAAGVPEPTPSTSAERSRRRMIPWNHPSQFPLEEAEEEDPSTQRDDEVSLED